MKHKYTVVNFDRHHKIHLCYNAAICKQSRNITFMFKAICPLIKIPDLPLWENLKKVKIHHISNMSNEFIQLYDIKQVVLQISTGVLFCFF